MITCCIQDGEKVFADSRIVDPCAEILLQESQKHGCDVLAYLFMPNHCHFILRGISETSDPLKAVRYFKQKTGFWLSKNASGAKWQRSYYDHIIRDENEMERHIGYILENPIRKDLVSNWQKYPFKGSSVYDFGEW